MQREDRSEYRRTRLLAQRILEAVVPMLNLSSEQGATIKLDMKACCLVVEWRSGATVVDDESEQSEVQLKVAEVLQHCNVRANLAASRDQLRVLVPRNVPWQWCQMVWQWLRQDIPVFRIARLPLAGRVRLEDRLQQLLHVTTEDELFLENWPEAESPLQLIVRVGLDGTKKWRAKHELAAMSIARGHRVATWSPVGYYFGSETQEVLREFLRGTGWEAETEKLKEVVLPLSQRKVGIVWILCGDHMFHVACGDCDPPGSRRDPRHLCQFCNATPTVCSH